MVKSRCQWAKVAHDGPRVTNGDLDVRLELDARAVEGRFPFLKDTANRLEGATLRGFDGGDGGVQHEGIAVAFQPVVVSGARTFVSREGLALCDEFFGEQAGNVSQPPGETHIKQIEAVAKLDDGSEDGGALDLTALAAGLSFGPFLGASGAVLPEIDAGAEPVVGVLTGGEFRFSRQHGIRHAPVAAVEGEDGALVGKEVHWQSAVRLQKRRFLHS